MELLLYMYLLLWLIIISYIVTNGWFLVRHLEKWASEKLINWYNEYKYKQTLRKARRHLKEKCGFTDEQIDRKIVIAQLRSHFLFFGYDTSDMTDDELEQGIVETSKLIANWGISADEAAEAFSELGRQLNNAEVGVS